MEEDKKKVPGEEQEQKGRVEEKKGSSKKASGKGLNSWLFIGVGVGAIIVVLIILFLTGVVSFGKVAASVDGTKIYLSQVEKEYEAYAASYKQSNKKSPDKKMEKEIKKLIMERLIQQELVKQAADKEGTKVTKKELDERIEQIKKSTSKKQLDKTLKQMNWTMDDLRNMLENQILSQKLREKVTKGVKVSDKDVKDYYEKNKKQYEVPETVKAKVATLKKKKEADALAASVKGGEDFDKAVKKYVKGGVTAQQLGKDQIVGIYGKELADAVFALDAGGTTGAVKTKNGTYVAKVEKKEKGHQKKFSEVKEEVKNMLKSQKEMEKFNKYTQDQRKKAKVKVYIKELETKGNLPSSHP
ncbi:MAG: hypothetical protein E3J54_00425 [Actinobacteria bacterium]|nr:MAG: hypothetical protein E3J54_00425 [Actinomycetota bacterium]